MPPSLRDIASALLAHVEAVYGARGVTLPDRRYVTVGGSDEALDCEQLTVAFERLVPGQPGATVTGPQRCVTMRFAEFRVQDWRCHPVADPDPPSASALTDAALGLLDIAAALNHAGETATLVLPEEFRDYGAATGGVSALGPEGGYAGAQLLVQIPLP